MDKHPTLPPSKEKKKKKACLITRLGGMDSKGTRCNLVCYRMPVLSARSISNRVGRIEAKEPGLSKMVRNTPIATNSDAHMHAHIEQI